MSRIAIVGRDARIYIAAGDAPGGDPRPLTAAGMRCAWPTWSPGGGTLAYSAYPSAGSNGQGAFRIMTQALGGSGRAAYVNEPGTDAIAHHTPHYAMWSPDGGTLAFIAQRLGAGLTLMALDVEGAADPMQLLSGAPLHFCWARDSRRILAHTREVHYLIDLADPTAAQVPVASLGYMAPSASPTDDLVAMCGEITDGTQALLITRLDGTGSAMAGEIAGAVGFSWSPSGEYLAIASELNRAAGFYGALSLLDVRTFEERLLLEEALLCFFWSPDSRRIAYITPSSDGADGSVRWGVLDLASGERRYLADFQPSREQLTMFMFFDQYSQSHSLWSPDGKRLLFAGALGWLETRAELPDSGVSSVYAVDVDGGDVALIGEGSLGVWSA